MKLSHARILVYLANAEKRFAYGSCLARKLGMDYVYTTHQLKQLDMNGFIQPRRLENKKFYSLTNFGVEKLGEALKTIENKNERKNKTGNVEERTRNK